MYYLDYSGTLLLEDVLAVTPYEYTVICNILLHSKELRNVLSFDDTNINYNGDIDGIIPDTDKVIDTIINKTILSYRISINLGKQSNWLAIDYVKKTYDYERSYVEISSDIFAHTLLLFKLPDHKYLITYNSIFSLNYICETIDDIILLILNCTGNNVL